MWNVGDVVKVDDCWRRAVCNFSVGLSFGSIYKVAEVKTVNLGDPDFKPANAYVGDFEFYLDPLSRQAVRLEGVNGWYDFSWFTRANN